MTARTHVVETRETDPPLAASETLPSASAPPHPSHADTLPVVPGRPRALALREDAAFRALSLFATAARTQLAARAWDNLAHVEAFARALRFCVRGDPLDASFDASASSNAASMPPAIVEAPLLARFVDDIERRRIAELLVALLPPPARTRPTQPLPEDIAVRADLGFPLAAGDVPRFAPVLSAHLADEDLLARALIPGARVLAPRAVCPFAARGSALVFIIDELLVDSAGDAAARGRALLADGSTVDVRRGPDGAPLRSVDGREQKIEVKLSQLTGLLLGAGPDARGLDLRFSDDRCLLLAYTALLRERGLFTKLERADAHTRNERVALVSACVRAAHDAVSVFSLDPLACAIRLDSHDDDLGWPVRAWDMLDATGAVRDATPRSERAGFAREATWLDAVVPPGFAAGRLSAVAAGRAFARLVTSVLAPLGVLPCSGLRDGSGAVLLQTLQPPRHAEAGSTPPGAEGEDLLGPPLLASFGATPRLEPLDEAWAAGRGLLLPEPRHHPQHDLQSMPTWIAFFLEAALPEVSPLPPDAARPFSSLLPPSRGDDEELS